MLRLLPALALFVFGGVATAEPDVRPVGKILVYFETDQPSSLWKAKAFQEAVKSYIASFDRLRIDANDKAIAECADFDCQMLAAEKQQVDYFWVGKWDGDGVKYSIFDVEKETAFTSGRLRPADWSGNGLQVQALAAVHPLTKPGGPIEMKGRVESRQEAALLSSHPTLSEVLNSRWGIFLSLLTGMICGTLLLRCWRFCFGTTSGLSRIDHASIQLFLKSWLEVAAQKALAVGLCFGLPVYFSSRLLVPEILNHEAFWFVAAPLLTLTLFVLLMVWNWTASVALDRRFLKGVTDPDDWHDVISKYFDTYCKRLGIELPEDVLAKTYFYLGSTMAPVTYGGLGGKVRIVIPGWILEQAFGSAFVFRKKIAVKPEAHDLRTREPLRYNEPRSVIWPLGLQDRFPKRKNEDSFEDLKTDYRYAGSLELQNRPLDVKAATWGYILPKKSGESVPLISNHQNDFEVVEDLVSEHHIFYAKAKLEEQFDDLDPNHKDFLIGALLQQIGYIHRRDTLLTTTQVFFYEFFGWTPALLRLPFDLLARWYEKKLSRYPAVIADAYPALHHAGDQFAQYLYFLGTRRTDKLTSRTTRKTISERTNEIFQWADDLTQTSTDLQMGQATLRNRFVWLAPFMQKSVSVPEKRRRIPWKRSLVALAFLGALGSELYIGYEYHPYYLEELQSQKDRIALAKDKADGKEPAPTPAPTPIPWATHKPPPPPPVAPKPPEPVKKVSASKSKATKSSTASKATKVNKTTTTKKKEKPKKKDPKKGERKNG